MGINMVKSVSLIDIDSKLPNLALMKISAYHKAQGDEVFLNHYDNPDLVYVSCIFKENASKAYGLQKMFNCPVIIGGPGAYSGPLKDEIEFIMPDYSLYGIDYAMGYTQRGCIRACPFCIVPKLEGKFREHTWFDTFWNGQKKMILLDNNFLASAKWKEKLEWLIDNKIKVSFCQGLDIRLITRENAELLKQVQYYDLHFNEKRLYFAFDSLDYEQEVRKGIEILLDVGISPKNMMFYVLTGFDLPFKDDYRRYRILWEEFGVYPFIMLYNNGGSLLQRKFARYVNKRIHKVVPFYEYDRLTKEEKEIVTNIIKSDR